MDSPSWKSVLSGWLLSRVIDRMEEELHNGWKKAGTISRIPGTSPQSANHAVNLIVDAYSHVPA